MFSGMLGSGRFFKVATRRGRAWGRGNEPGGVRARGAGAHGRGGHVERAVRADLRVGRGRVGVRSRIGMVTHADGAGRRWIGYFGPQRILRIGRARRTPGAAAVLRRVTMRLALAARFAIFRAYARRATLASLEVFPRGPHERALFQGRKRKAEAKTPACDVARASRFRACLARPRGAFLHFGTRAGGSMASHPGVKTAMVDAQAIAKLKAGKVRDLAAPRPPPVPPPRASPPLT